MVVYRVQRAVFGCEVGDLVVYNAETPDTPYWRHHPLQLDPGALLAADLDGDLTPLTARPALAVVAGSLDQRPPAA